MLHGEVRGALLKLSQLARTAGARDESTALRVAETAWGDEPTPETETAAWAAYDAARAAMEEGANTLLEPPPAGRRRDLRSEDGYLDWLEADRVLTTVRAREA